MTKAIGIEMATWKKAFALIATSTCLTLGASVHSLCAQDALIQPDRDGSTTIMRSQTLPAPTIIVRPSVDGSALNDCQLEVNKIAGTADNFSIRLMVPDSVKSVELIPSTNQGAQRNFRIQMDQNDSSSTHAPMTQGVAQQRRPSERFAANQSLASQVSSLNQDQQRVKNKFLSPRDGFIKNPHFQLPAPYSFGSRQSGPRIIEEQSYEEVQREGQHPVAQRINAISELGSDLHNREPMILSGENDWRSGTATASNSSPNYVTNNSVPFVDSESIGTQATPLQTNSVQRDPSILVAENINQIASSPKRANAKPTVAQSDAALPAAPTTFEANTTTSLMSELVGLRKISLGHDGDFAVFMANPSSDTLTDIVVTLQLPVGLEVVLLDRSASLDRHSRTVKWALDSIEPGGEAIIRYRVNTQKLGSMQQTVSVSANNKDGKALKTDCELKSNVLVESAQNSN